MPLDKETILRILPKILGPEKTNQIHCILLLSLLMLSFFTKYAQDISGIYFFDLFNWTTGIHERWDGCYQREPYIGVGSFTNKYISLIQMNNRNPWKMRWMQSKRTLHRSWFLYQQIYFFDWFKWTTGMNPRKIRWIV